MVTKGRKKNIVIAAKKQKEKKLGGRGSNEKSLTKNCLHLQRGRLSNSEARVRKKALGIKRKLGRKFYKSMGVRDSFIPPELKKKSCPKKVRIVRTRWKGGENPACERGKLVGGNS